ncbi:MAG: DASS family sodium-coupled anion symporter [Candidatus Eremiobacteraeota bacterium]|nr:DASS family sodium-coupled anion symporter [Candidatus Eremiobacteraeota bacterium]
MPLGIGIVLALIPAPAGLDPGAWHYFAFFAAVIAALITEPLPAAAIGLIGLTLAAASQAVVSGASDSMKWGLSGFANDTVWLIFAAYMFALGYEKTGLGRRISLMLVKGLGSRTIGLGYAIAFADLILAPFTPSNTARSGGTIYPIVKNIPPLYGSEPGPTARKIGSYLMYVSFAITCVTSSMFLTALAPNLLALTLSNKITHLSISWSQWFVGFLPIGILLFILVPLVLYFVYPPEIKAGAEVSKWAGEQLAGEGPLRRSEIVLAVLVGAALLMWIFGSALMAPALVAIAVICAMLLTNTIDWNDVLGNKQAWNVLVWFATLVTLADGLNKVGFLTWIAKTAGADLAGFAMIPLILVLVAIFFVVHYFFASLTAQATALLPLFIATVAAVPGAPMGVVTLMMAFSLGLMGVLTPYATGPAPIYAHSGYIETKDFWKLGALMGAIYLAALLFIDGPWLFAIMK